MELSLGIFTLFATLTLALAQQEPQIAPQSTQHAPQGRSAPLLGVRYSASTDVSHSSFSSPLVTYGDSLNDIQLPAAPIQPANLKQAPQEEDDEERLQNLVRSGNQAQSQPQQVESQNQVTQAIQLQRTPSDEQFISIQQYPARPKLQQSPRGFSLSQNLPGPQPQVATRYAQQYEPIQTQPQYAAAQPQQYATPQPQQYTVAQPQQYNVAQPQQYTVAQPQQYATAQPQQYAPPLGNELQQPQVQYQSPVAYSTPSSNAYFATGPLAAQYPASNLVARQYPAQSQYTPSAVPQNAQPAPQYTEQIPSQYVQSVAPQYAPQPSPSQYVQPVAQGGLQYASQSALPSAPAQVVSRVSFNGPVGGFSYQF